MTFTLTLEFEYNYDQFLKIENFIENSIFFLKILFDKNVQLFKKLKMAVTYLLNNNVQKLCNVIF